VARPAPASRPATFSPGPVEKVAGLEALGRPGALRGYEQLGCRGTTREQLWVNRRMLLTGADHLSDKQWARLEKTLQAEDSTKEIAAWAVKERLRMLLAQTEPHRIRRRLFDFYNAAVDAHLDEATRLARTIDTWWPAILVTLTEDVTNARTEGFNRIINKPNASTADSPTWRTTKGASWSTSPSPDDGRSMTRHPAESRRAGLGPDP
jgi:transposase